MGAEIAGRGAYKKPCLPTHRRQFLLAQPTRSMYKFVVLACAVAAVAAEADPSLAYANGLHYAAGAYPALHAAGAYAALPAAGYAAGYAPYTAGYAPINYAAAVHAPVVPAVHAAVAPAVAPAVVHAAPAASAYALPPVRTRAEAPIVETVVEPVEQWGYKVAY